MFLSPISIQVRDVTLPNLLFLHKSRVSVLDLVSSCNESLIFISIGLGFTIFRFMLLVLHSEIDGRGACGRVPLKSFMH